MSALYQDCFPCRIKKFVVVDPPLFSECHIPPQTCFSGQLTSSLSACSGRHRKARRQGKTNQTHCVHEFRQGALSLLTMARGKHNTVGCSCTSTSMPPCCRRSLEGRARKISSPREVPPSILLGAALAAQLSSTCHSLLRLALECHVTFANRLTWVITDRGYALYLQSVAEMARA